MLRSFVLSLTLLFALVNQSWGQEELYDLVLGNEKPPSEAKSSAISSRVNVEDLPFIYVVDTLSLPFFDDFTTNLVKTFNAQESDPNVSLKIQYDFRVNGTFPDTLEYLRDTTYSKLKTTTGDVIESPNPTLFIVLFEDGKVVEYDTGWTNVVTEFDQGSGLVSYDSLEPDVQLYNLPDTFFKVADDNSLWTPPVDTIDSNRSAPFINKVYDVNGLTQGVATFNGTDRNGFPYDISSETSYGLADILTSKPLALDSNMDSVYLTFFYQTGGYGNMPEEEDSLVVEFFDVVDSTWRFAWKGVSDLVNDTGYSNEVRLNIDGRRYLQPGFMFRFKNYATLSANMDHWNIDYVRLEQDLDTNSNDTIINDVAIVSGISTFLRSYQSVPYDHYLADPSFFDSNAVSFVIRNLGNDTAVTLGLRYEIFDEDDNLISSEVTVDPNIPPFTVRTVNFPIETGPIFPDLGSKYADFTIQCRYTSSGVQNQKQINDTIRTKQEFRHYYAYDDGTAEQAYALTGAGLRLAYEFDSPVRDTLKGIGFNFPQTLHNKNEDLDIEILVWADLDEEPIYTAQQLVTPNYTKANDFLRIALDTTVIVEDKFYVGFRQVEQTKIYIGFDVNTNSRKRIHYKISDEWFTSSFQGSLLIRPDFGDGSLLAVPDRLSSAPLELDVYPNPCTDVVRIDTKGQRILNTQVFDLSGRLCLKRESSGSSIDVSSLENGMYLMRVTLEGGQVAGQQIIVNR